MFVAVLPLLLLLASATVSSSDSRSVPLWVVNVSSLPPDYVPLFQSAQGAVNRGSDTTAGTPAALLMLVGLTSDNGADSALLAFLRARYGSFLSVDESRVLAGEEEPWRLFQLPFVKSSLSDVVFCGSNDARPALSAALSVASAHGGAAATCASPSGRKDILARTGLRVLADLSGRWPVGDNSTTGSNACTEVNAFVAALPSGNFSSVGWATWPSGGAGGVPTTGYDYVTSERLLTMCMDSAGSDWNTTQSSLLARYPPLARGFGERNRFCCCAIFFRNTTVCQDRLGTNMRETQTRRRVPLGGKRASERASNTAFSHASSFRFRQQHCSDTCASSLHLTSFSFVCVGLYLPGRPGGRKRVLISLHCQPRA
jgi:hypothetical protein